MPATDTRLAFRATPADLAALTAIAEGLREAGDAFATRTDAFRHALQEAAAALPLRPKTARP